MSDAQTLGSELRAAREARDLTLDQAEQQTRIRSKYLEALEEGKYAVLPSAVQARGFLRNYARFLNLDADHIVGRYDALQGGRRRRRAAPTTSAEDPTMLSPSRRTKEMHAVLVKPPAGPPLVEPPLQGPRRRFQFMGIIIGGIALLILAGLLIVGAQTLQAYLARNNNNGLILSPLPQTINSTAGAATTAVTSQPLRPSPLPSPVPNVEATASTVKGTGSGVALTLNITERTWIRVTVDGTVTYVGSAAPNTTLKYEGSTINVRVANAIGVHVTLNNQYQGVMRARGQIVDQTYTVNSGSNAPTTAPPNATGAGQTTGQTSLTSPGATFSLTPNPRFSPIPSVLPPRAPSKTFTNTPTSTPTPTVTWTPSITYTPSITRTPTITFTPSITPTGTPTVLILPHETSTSEGGDIRPK